ncbi:MAG: 50S ribosomal protein L25 [Deltaproteobacteria bacterium]|nr:50S ribosomal protein L25 [Deltaproteobacteria bacterium]NND30544.1 50S ribosomal protein L25 [Myxococcales bacterium]MBT8482508.1 50S ribosomal protein L25 [Deltaproteobacteria bacterium]NNK07278.1 50S ribosomal protein L25 [Myxococcales bacterium]NNK42931.1 50S ribosomal protein L25 [Myxococcales bacterium]
METTTLQAEVRAGRGKGPARRLRAEGKVPGVFYGPGVEPTPLTLSPKELTKALRGERGRNVVFKLSVDGKDELAMVKDLTTDPVTQELLHIDLYRILEDKVLEVNVPFRTYGRSVGVVQGGVLNVTRRVLPLRTTPAKIPISIDVDVTHLALKDTISVEEIELPEGVECSLNPKLTLVIILEPRKATAAEVEEDEAAAAAAEAAKPAAEPETAAT